MRSRAGSMSNRSTTVPQGTLIPAVLETAFNSTGSGFARALVQRDIYGFDGARVLIPRGSRLIGEYASDTSPGRSEEHTSELQSLMRISYAVFCLKKKNHNTTINKKTT